ncbi:LOW QUALITY PROTEIN: hypothetical protein TorRG33x02_044100 [Trema orientale]|uniref:Transmembrane protein n=1 Tax=Trema orientale TaxID=63057 RepID=A0A2P5FPB9_TREOI|nr:LOW QUALITY PROTEIN: hypothetical protein TorRG33x02_044100 [Trema orientale]
MELLELLERTKKAEEVLVSLKGGAGPGCDVRTGFGLIGGLGYDSEPCYHLNLVFGVALGWVVGVGFGFREGHRQWFASYWSISWLACLLVLVVL